MDMSLMESFILVYGGALFQDGNLVRTLHYVVYTRYDGVFLIWEEPGSGGRSICKK